jgi:hypothetical protein
MSNRDRLKSYKVRLRRRDAKRPAIDTGVHMADVFQFDKQNRRHQRKIYHVEIYFSLESRAYPAKIINISLGGALLDNAGFPKISVGQVITVNIPFKKAEQSVKRKARVMWVSEIQFGIKFI